MGTHPLLISTGFLKYPLELKKTSVRTEEKLQLVYTEFFFQFLLKFYFSSNGYFKKPVEINRGWRHQKVILRLTDLFRVSVQLWNFQARFSVTRLVHERILGMLADFPEVMLIQNWKKFDQYSTHSELYYTKSTEINIFTRTFLRSKSNCIYCQIVTKIFIKDLHQLKPLQNKKGQKNLGYPRKKQSFYKE